MALSNINRYRKLYDSDRDFVTHFNFMFLLHFKVYDLKKLINYV